ncbi:hypothetical protein EJP82_27150 [Paenibacillus anaericanus]|uniref:Uncharacterized protein n=1 Tax=Paenibacillus anaericanus TaxID=170367 RepID=A0A3S1DHT8_9BACL|nr:hypothetical protein EJP82_27150 [Paenibacillus anaericanus]
MEFHEKRYVVETLVSELLLRCEESRIQVTAIGYLDEIRSSMRGGDSVVSPLIVGELKRGK